MASGNRIPREPFVPYEGNPNERFTEPVVIDGKSGVPERYHSNIEVILALQKARGFRSIAAQVLGMTINGLNKRIRESEDLKQTIRDIEHYWIDHTEIKLFEAVDAGDVEAIKFVLKCKGRMRGWVDRREVMMGVTIGEFDEAQKPPDLVLGFLEAVNPNAPDGTTAIVPRPSNGNGGSTSTTTGTSDNATTNGHGTNPTGQEPTRKV